MSKRNILIISAVVIIVALVIILVASSSRTIPEEKFVQLYIELSLTHERYKYNPPKLEKKINQELERLKREGSFSPP